MIHIENQIQTVQIWTVTVNNSLSADKVVCKQFDPDQALQNNSPHKIGFKFIDIQMAFLKDFFEKAACEKKSADDKKSIKITGPSSPSEIWAFTAF